MQTVDARGQACPQPVILARKALEGVDELVVIVDNETAQMNVTRMAEKAGCRVEFEHRNDGTYLNIAKTMELPVGQVALPAAGQRVVLVASDTLGRGSAELGEILVRGFFHTLNEVQPLPSAIVFMNSGVQLVAEGSPVLDDLRALDDKGVEVWACGTCLDYYGLKAKLAVGQVSNMYSIAEALLQAGSVISI
jgi:selenium metabolism protein YedF